jgi:hypothetical protein
MDNEPNEPDNEAGDITTGNYRKFYQYGKLWLALTEDESDEFGTHVRAKMEAESFFPNVWFISDHGNPHQLLT